MNKENKKKTRLNKAGFLFLLKQVASFIWPVKLQTYASGLEVVLYNGVVMLNSAKANYSYGNLQLAYQRLFKEVALPWSSIKQVLVLGYGAGGVSALIKQKQGDARQVGVEPSKEVLEAYHNYFQAVSDVEVKCIDASDFLTESNQTFDLIVVDIYEELNVPDVFQSKRFVSMLPKRLNQDGIVLFNKVVAHESHRNELNELMLYFSQYFSSVCINEQLSLNHFILAKNDKKAVFSTIRDTK